MKIKFLVAAFLGIAGVLMWPGTGFASAREVPVATFDRTLAVLRQSVVDLVKENRSLNARNLEMRAQVKSLNDELRALQAETARLENKRAAEEKRTKTRSTGADALKVQIAQADDLLKQARDDLAFQQKQFDALQKEDLELQQRAAQLSADIADMGLSGSSSGADRQDLSALKAERDALADQVNEAAKRIQQAKRQWEQANTLATTGPEQVDAIKVERDSLVKAVPQLEAELAKVDVQLDQMQAELERFAGEDHSEMRIGRLESEVKDMVERNRKLEAEIVTTQKAREEQLKRLADDRERLRKQYEAEYKEISQRNADLKLELDHLRKQMVDLDKKKSALEAVIYNAR